MIIRNAIPMQIKAGIGFLRHFGDCPQSVSSFLRKTAIFPLKVFTKTQKSGKIIYYGITMETRRKKLEKR